MQRAWLKRPAYYLRFPLSPTPYDFVKHLADFCKTWYEICATENTLTQ
jgi:hypothetical protein